MAFDYILHLIYRLLLLFYRVEGRSATSVGSCVCVCMGARLHRTGCDNELGRNDGFTLSHGSR